MRPSLNLAQWVNWQQPGGMISAGLHVVMLAAAVIGFSTTKPFNPAVEAAPVDVISETQFNEMMKGEKQGEKSPEPQQRADRQAEIKQQNDPGEAKRDVPVEPPKAEVKPDPPPLPPPLPTPPVRPQVAAVAPPVRAPELRTRPVPPPEPEEEEEGEPIKKAAPKPPEPKKIEPPKPQPDQVARLLQEKEQQEARAKAEATARAEQRRIEEQKEKAAAEAKAKAEADRRQREAREKAAQEKAAREKAEADKLNDAIRNRLNASREAPSSTGASAPSPSRQASLGAEQATGRKLSPSDRSRLVGLLTEQMSRCISYSGSAPKTYPRITFTLGRDGSVIGNVNLANNSAERNFRPFSEAAMRAVRNCQPYRIPSSFLDTYEDWKNIVLTLITDDLQ